MTPLKNNSGATTVFSKQDFNLTMLAVWWVLFDMATKTILKTLFNMGLKVNGELNITITQFCKEY